MKYLSDNTKHMYMARDKSSFLGLYNNKPNKLNTSWFCCGGAFSYLNVFNKLFQFVKWEDEESTPIKDVLDNCEVVEDAKEL